MRPADLQFRGKYCITDFGAGPDRTAVENTAAVNAAVNAASEAGGGTVIVPAGVYRCYTVHLKSRVHLHLEDGAVLRAARTELEQSYVRQKGEGGNYEAPEINRYAGLQDHGHSYFANSLIYAADCRDIMISGKGLIDGSSWNREEGCREFVLLGGDPIGSVRRSEKGYRKEWFGNKGIALVRCENVVMTDFSVLIGGHFAIITEGVKNMYCENLLVDTNRDAFDVDCCQDVTVKNCWFNSLTDDGLVMKSSFGAACFMPLMNMRIEDCKVTGYDAGSVYAKTFTNEKLVAEDRCGPTGRIKFGTEASCGYEQVTILRTSFEHSRGFAMEAVDGSDLRDIIFRDCIMKHVSSSPVFIRIGDRCRFPVTGMHRSDEISAPAPNVRLDNPGFVIPDTPEYGKYPAVRYTPSYNRNRTVSVDGCSSFAIVDGEEPLRVNEANFAVKDGKYYGRKYVEGEGYVTDWEEELTEAEAKTRGNACSRPLAKAENILIENLKVEDADPRYPIILMGLDGSCIENVVLKNIDITWRGGLSMTEAVEQRQLNTNWEYRQYKTKSQVQSIPWLVNTFFLKNEGLLPRADWNDKTKSWEDDPYNVPELPNVYPEPSNWGILPAYGMYARHVRGLSVENIRLHTAAEDGRHAVVLDDVEDAEFGKLSVQKGGTAGPGRNPEPEDSGRPKERPGSGECADAALVTNLFKRPAGFEYVPDWPYHMTSVSGIALPEGISVKLVKVAAPAPGTPQDSFWTCPTVAVPENGYSYKIPTEEYPLPKTVYPPFLVVEQEGIEGEERPHEGIGSGMVSLPVEEWPVRPCCSVRAGEKLALLVKLCDPASQASRKAVPGAVYSEDLEIREFTVYPEVHAESEIVCSGLPETAEFSASDSCGRLTWTPEKPGRYSLLFEAVRAGEAAASVTCEIDVV